MDNYAVLIFRPDKDNPTRKGGMFLERVFLNPGRNTLSKSQFTTISNSSLYKGLVDKSAITIIQEGLDADNGDELVSLKDLTIKKAEELIAAETDLTLLKQWQSSEPKTKNRLKVINAIANQINAIERGDL